MRFFLLLPVLLGAAILAQAAEESYPVHEDSKVHEGVPKGEMIKGTYTADGNSVFPGTEREYQIYISAGLDKTKPAPFMVFQDGVIYNAPVVFDNLIAKKEIPAMIGIFIKPGVVPAANPEALPRFNRSYEYDSVTDTYSRFLIDEFLPAITQKHGITLSTDPNDAGISGNSSGGICAFMVAWHRSDRFRRVFTGVGTYVGIHGADQLPVLVRKMEPKPIKVYLQSGENDNNLYCGDWWMANQMMERSLTWAGYDVAHTWGTGGHNGKQATAIFPDVMRWLWKGYPETKEIKANPEGKSKWLGYQVLKEGSEWEEIWKDINRSKYIASNRDGVVMAETHAEGDGPLDDVAPISRLIKIPVEGNPSLFCELGSYCSGLAFGPDGRLYMLNGDEKLTVVDSKGEEWNATKGGQDLVNLNGFCINSSGMFFAGSINDGDITWGKLLPLAEKVGKTSLAFQFALSDNIRWNDHVALSPDQTLLYTTHKGSNSVVSWQTQPNGSISKGQAFYSLEASDKGKIDANGLCLDTNGWLYVATALGLQICDQAGRVNFIIPTPQQPYDVCFGGKDLSELFIACGNKIYKRQTKVHGVVSGQQPPIKPAPPKL